MQKVTEFLEKNVQWVAIGLGALFVLFMVWTYVINPPAQVTIAGQQLGPGEVDPYTEEHVAQQLDSEMNKGGTITLVVPRHVQKFKDAMSWKDAVPLSGIAEVWQAETQDVQLPAPPPNPNAPPGTAVVQQNPQQQPPPGVEVQKVAALPEIPPAVPAEHQFGRSVIIPPQPNGQAAPPPPAPAVPGQPVPGTIDKDWVTQLFKINLADLDKSFTAAHIPQGFTTTLFLQVVMEREELDSNGKPVPNTLETVAPLAVWRTGPPPPYPNDKDPNVRDQQAQYLAWASANTPDILEPLFYTTVPNQGNQWTKPGEQPAAQQAVFNPQQYLLGDIPGWVTAEQKQQIYQARQAEQKRKADEQKAKRPAPAPRTPSRGGPTEGDAGGGRNYAPAAPVRATPPPPPPNRGPVRAPPYAPPGRPTPTAYDNPEGDMGGVGPSAVAPPGLPQPGTDYPTGEFDVHDPKWANKVPPTIEVWAHDETIKAGKTYHYRIVYKIRNPIYGSNAGATPELNQQFDVASKPSEWSSPVLIPNLVNFFVQSSKSPNANTVRFDVFRWDKGTQKMETFSVGPGDQVGATKNGIDFSTDWTLVDFRFDDRQGDWQILMLNNKDGNIILRSYKADKDDGLYKGLKDQVQALKAVAGGPGGAPPILP